MDYFANASKDDIAARCEEKVTDFYRYLEVSGRLYLYRSLYDMYFRARTTRGNIYVSGENGQFLNLDTGDFRNLLQHLKVLTTQARSTFIPVATNTDSKSEEQTRTAKGILEYYVKDKKIGRTLDQCAEYTIVYADGYICADWDTSLGRTVMVDKQQNEDGTITEIPLKEGDYKAKAFDPINVILDFSARCPRDADWYIIREYVNKYEIAARSPELKEDIIALSDNIYLENKDRLWVYNQREQYDSDRIPVYTLYHQRTAAVPNGRMTRFLNGKIMLFDGDLPFEDFPVYRMIAMEEGESAFGYSVSFDLLPICDALRKLYSTLITTESVSGIPVILIPEGGNIDLTDLSDGIKGLSYNPALGEPKVLHLGMSSPQTGQMIELLKELSQVISAVNAVARGETPDNLNSGSSLALVLSTAIQFNSGLQRSYAEVSEDVGTGLIQFLQVFGKTPRMYAIAGLSNQYSMKSWSQKDISNIHRVTVELGNPIQQTAGGRMKLAEDMLSKGLVRTADRYLEVVMTGRLEPMTEDEDQELIYIRHENEVLAKGGYTRAVVTDQHIQHIHRHRYVISSDEAKNNPQIVKAVLDHIQEHIKILADPALGNLLSALGQAPPMPQGPPPMPQKGDAPSSTVLPKDNLPKMPNMPNNPMTGQPVM